MTTISSSPFDKDDWSLEHTCADCKTVTSYDKSSVHLLPFFRFRVFKTNCLVGACSNRNCKTPCKFDEPYLLKKIVKKKNGIIGRYDLGDGAWTNYYFLQGEIRSYTLEEVYKIGRLYYTGTNDLIVCDFLTDNDKQLITKASKITCCVM